MAVRAQKAPSTRPEHRAPATPEGVRRARVPSERLGVAMGSGCGTGVRAMGSSPMQNRMAAMMNDSMAVAP